MDLTSTGKPKHNPTPENRKRKNVNRKLSRLEIRLYPDEKQAIQSKAKSASSTASELVRQSLLRVQTWTAKDKQSYKQRTREISRIGSNLNQIARWCNIHKGAADTVEVVAHLKAIEQEIKGLSNGG